jgi:hypothetical protein
MPLRRSPHRIALIAIAGLTALAAFCLHTLISNSARPGAYYAYRHSAADFVFPAQEVVTWGLAIVVETLVASGVLLLRRSPVATCAGIAAIFGTSVVFLMPLAMHAPPYYGGHLVFVLLSAMWLGLIVIVAGIVRLLLRLLGVRRAA